MENYNLFLNMFVSKHLSVHKLNFVTARAETKYSKSLNSKRFFSVNLFKINLKHPLIYLNAIKPIISYVPSKKELRKIRLGIN